MCIRDRFVNSYGKINLELIECLENGEVLELYGFLGEHNEVPVRLNLLSNEEKEKLLELVNIGDGKDLNINTPIAHLDIPDTKSIFPIDKKCEDYVKNNIPEFIKLHKPTRKISYPLTDIPKDIYAFFRKHKIVAGIPAISKPISNPFKVPINIKSLKSPRWPILKTFPASFDSPPPSVIFKFSKIIFRRLSALCFSGNITAVKTFEKSFSSLHTFSKPQAWTAALVASACFSCLLKTLSSPSS